MTIPCKISTLLYILKLFGIPVYAFVLKEMAKIQAALVQALDIKDSITLIHVHNSPISMGRFSFNAFRAEKHMDRQHPR